MNDNKNKYQVEDFWPDAEKLLDEHFNNKNGGNKTGIWIIALISIITIAGLVYLSIGPNVNTIAPISQSKQDISNTNSVKPNKQINANLTSQKTTKLDLIDSPILDNNKSSAIEQPKTESDHAVSITDINLNNDRAIDNKPQIDTDTQQNKHKVKKEKTKSFKSITSNKLSIQNISETKFNGSNATTEVETSNQAKRPTDLKNSNFSELTKKPNKIELQKDVLVTNNQDNTTQNQAVQPDLNSEKTVDNSTLNKISKQVNSEDTIVENGKNNTIESQNLKKQIAIIDTIEKQNLNKQTAIKDTIEQIADNSTISIEKDSITTSNKPQFGILFNAGIFNTTKKLISSNSQDLIERRNKEEGSAYFSSWGIGLNLKYKKISITTGIEYNTYGEKINYSDSLYQNTNVIQPKWNYFTDSLNTINYTYYNGIEYQRPITDYFSDSTIYYDTTYSLAQSTVDLSSFRGTNSISYLEIPLSINYLIFHKNNWNIGLLAGGTIGFLKQTQGYYLTDDLKSILDLSQTNIVRKTQFNGRFGLNLGYSLSTNSSVFIEPQYRFAFKSAFEDSYIVSQKYRSLGLSIGYMFVF
jgi:hypothetical protein